MGDVSDRLEVKVISARDLPESTGGECNPFAVVSCASGHEQTGVASGTRDPEWRRGPGVVFDRPRGAAGETRHVRTPRGAAAPRRRRRGARHPRRSETMVFCDVDEGDVDHLLVTCSHKSLSVEPDALLGTAVVDLRTRADRAAKPTSGGGDAHRNQRSRFKEDADARCKRSIDVSLRAGACCLRASSRTSGTRCGRRPGPRRSRDRPGKCG